MAERMFNLEEAEKILPQLEGWLRTAIESKKKIAEIEDEYKDLLRSVSLAGGRVIDLPYWINRKRETGEWSLQLRSAAEQIQDSGCLLKDLDSGLIDFPSEVDGREIYLCWKLGEPAITFWHNTDEGFAGRKPIDDKFLDGFKRHRPM
ncbi:MAG: DUF2203 domain-containing protein [Acidobacteria bacterium]|nr:DUF2203 domain-containing protein [Acidobacteriota bacterium]